MIVIYTRYDQVSSILTRCAESLIVAASSQLSQKLGPPEDSKAVSIQAALASNKASIFFFGHGIDQPYGLISQDGLPFINQEDSHFLEGRLICATCCHATKALEQAVSDFGATVVGYDGKLAIPYDEMYFPGIQKAILSGPFALLAGRTAGEVCQIMREGFNKLAHELMRGAIEDQVLAVFISANADLVKLSGDSERKM